MKKLIGRIALAGSIAMIATMFASAAPAHAAAGFGDVPAGQFYTEAVQWMVDEGITTGTSEGCFEPSAPATRGQVAAFLHRYKGLPAGGGEPFTDVGANHFFADAVAWMASTRVTTGVTPTTFEPNRHVTRGLDGRAGHHHRCHGHQLRPESTGYQG